MTYRNIYLSLVCSLLALSSAHASSVRGTTVGVADGDTITVLDGRTQYKVRLAEIDAPEKSQAFGQVSKKALSDLCYGKQAVVSVTTTDRYGRLVGRVSCDGVDANLAQVKSGMAWVYDQYASDRALYAAQDKARTSRAGLWVDRTPTPPWLWRRSH